ncbi:hypothetical protein D3C87_1051000 [compost metagenome]
MHRIVILGNSGSGYRPGIEAVRLAIGPQIPAVHLRLWERACSQRGHYRLGSNFAVTSSFRQREANRAYRLCLRLSQRRHPCLPKSSVLKDSFPNMQNRDNVIPITKYIAIST